MSNQPDHKKQGFSLFKLVLGAAVATGAGVYYATHKDEVDTMAKQQAAKIAKLFHESKDQVEKKVKEVWGQVNDEAIKKYEDIRMSILAAMEAENLEKHGAMIQKRYEEIVDKAISKAKKAGMIDAGIEKKLEKIYKRDWSGVNKVMKQAFAEARKTVGKMKLPAKSKPASKKAVSKTTKPSSAKKPAKNVLKKVVKKAIKRPLKK